MTLHGGTRHVLNTTYVCRTRTYVRLWAKLCTSIACRGKLKFMSQILQWDIILLPHAATKHGGNMVLNQNASCFTRADNHIKCKPGESVAFEKWQYVWRHMWRADFVLTCHLCTVFCNEADFEKCSSQFRSTVKRRRKNCSKNNAESVYWMVKGENQDEYLWYQHRQNSKQAHVNYQTVLV